MSAPRLTPFRLISRLAFLSALLLGVVLASLAAGTAAVSPAALFSGTDGAEGTAQARAILLEIRLPRILLAALAGAALAASGCACQALLRNPLADPYILGLSGGAALGAILASVSGLDRTAIGALARPGGAFAGACLTVVAILILARSGGRLAAYPMLLIGWIFNSFFLALILFLETAVDFSRVRSAIFWLVGTLAPEPYPILAGIGGAVAAGLLLLFTQTRGMDLLCAGEETALALGCPVERTRILGILAASMMTAAVVSFSGLIGFVGLIAPHAARFLFGPDHRLLVPASALMGAAGLVVADTLARTLLAPTEIPVGVITALVGGPIFILLYRRRHAEVPLE